jgi:hypothetical protein
LGFQIGSANIGLAVLVSARLVPLGGLLIARGVGFVLVSRSLVLIRRGLIGIRGGLIVI